MNRYFWNGGRWLFLGYVCGCGCWSFWFWGYCEGCGEWGWEGCGEDNLFLYSLWFGKIEIVDTRYCVGVEWEVGNVGSG